jgi:hypothetical protein
MNKRQQKSKTRVKKENAITAKHQWKLFNETKHFGHVYITKLKVMSMVNSIKH